MSDNADFTKTEKRFELDAGGQVAILEYIINKDNIMFLTHAEVPKSLEGTGFGSKIVKLTLEYIRDNGLKMAPMCPFVTAYMRRHPEWNSLLAEGYTV